MGDYRVSAWDINANTLLTDVRATGLSYNVRMNDSGEFGYSVNLSDAQAQACARVLMGLQGTPFKTIITANAGQTILYSGISWTTNKKSSSVMMPITGKGLTSYFTDKVIANDYKTSIAPGQLMAQAVNDAQADGPGANRGIVPIVTGLTSPPNVTPSYNKNQYTTVAQVLADQTAAITPGSGGVDYFMTDTFVHGAPAHSMVITSPRCGRDRNTSGLSVNLATVIDWEWPSDAMQSGNHLIVVGSGTGGAQPVATADDAAARGGLGQMPRMDMVLQYSQISNQGQLQGIANGSAVRYGKPITTPTVTIPADYAACALGVFQIGDDIKVWCAPNIHFPAGLSQWWRIVAYKVDIPDQGLAKVTLTLNPPPIF
ncbi:hypothetical protein [Arthrobacter sp. efr-133-TYG-118]|uniref:hypothetical protein n=1 Tax=Arthrobacter sp. efr-133-TYG-118 TaxID=3040279 RepID=UPI00254D75D2|nr:hypothetical protein [Arthrobacter sp. efr-133-TYG-118]